MIERELLDLERQLSGHLALTESGRLVAARAADLTTSPVVWVAAVDSMSRAPLALAELVRTGSEDADLNRAWGECSQRTEPFILEGDGAEPMAWAPALDEATVVGGILAAGSPGGYSEGDLEVLAQLAAAYARSVVRAIPWAQSEAVSRELCVIARLRDALAAQSSIRDMLASSAEVVQWSFEDMRRRALVVFDGDAHGDRDLSEDQACLTSDIFAGGRSRGRIAIAPSEPGLAPLAARDHQLLGAMAQTVGGALERRLAEEALREAYEHLEERVAERTEELREAHRALAESEARYRGIVEDQTELIFRCLSDMTAVFVNEAFCAQFDVSDDEIIGSNCLIAVHPEDRQMVDRFFRELRIENPVGTVEYRVEGPSGEICWLNWTCRALYDTRNEHLGYQAVGRDVTDRKQAEAEREQALAELERSNVELEQFAYIASHDLKEPLRTVSSSMELLAMDYGDHLPAEAQELVEQGVTGARRMEQLINDLLAYSRVGTRGKDFRPVASDEAVEWALENLGAAVAESQAEVSVGDLPLIEADPSQLTQLFQNLISNAIKFRGDEPLRIEVNASRQDGMWVFSVRDNGIGLEPRHAARIFEIFRRLHRADQYPGTGVGLAICKKIVERHGGTIWVESEPGNGAAFLFTIPAMDE